MSWEFSIFVPKDLKISSTDLENKIGGNISNLAYGDPVEDSTIAVRRMLMNIC